jgi:hypothetical protein
MHPLIRTARATGLFYLGLAVAPLLGTLVVRPRLFAPDNPAATLANLAGHDLLARCGVALGLAGVVAQALVALWFFRLFRSVDPFLAGAIAVFGLVNAVAMLIDTTLLGTALEVARHPSVAAATDAQLMYLASGALWKVSTLFFGLWLIPMGQCVLRSGWMPRALGRLLVVGGVGYVIAAFADYLLPPGAPVAEPLALLATVGELWMVGYLLVRGLNPRDHATAPADLQAVS